MAELRWLLLLIGIGIIAGVYIYTRYKTYISDQVRSLPFRREPSIGGATPDADPAAPETPARQEESVPEPGKVVAIRLMSDDKSGFEAERLILTLRELGLRHGRFGIFHCLEDDADDGAAVYSVASLVEPGSFDLTRIKVEHYPGISIFMTLPGPLSGVSSFDAMMDFARELARRLDGYLLDEQGDALSVQRERYMREDIIQFEHQGSG